MIKHQYMQYNCKEKNISELRLELTTSRVSEKRLTTEP